MKIENIKIIEGDKLEYYKLKKSHYSAAFLTNVFCVNTQVLNDFELRWKMYLRNIDNPNVTFANSLRLVIILEYMLKAMRLEVAEKLPISNTKFDLSIKQVRVLELLLRDLIYEQVGGGDLLSKKLSDFFNAEQIKSWIKNADESGLLSGTSFSELTTIFIHQEIFISLENYFQKWSIVFSPKIRETLRFAFEDIRVIRNQIAHNKVITFAQIELLNIYFQELTRLIEDRPQGKIKLKNYLGNDHFENEKFLSRIQLDRRDYWFAYIQYLKEKNTQIDPTILLPSAWHWMAVKKATITIAGFSSGAEINVLVNNNKKLISVELFFNYDEEKKIIDTLLELEFQNSKMIIDLDITWEKMEGSRASRIRLQKKGDFLDKSSWEEQFLWLHENTEKFIFLFGKYFSS